MNQQRFSQECFGRIENLASMYRSGSGAAGFGDIREHIIEYQDLDLVGLRQPGWCLVLPMNGDYAPTVWIKLSQTLCLLA
jgi:hypothetical protein